LKRKKKVIILQRKDLSDKRDDKVEVPLSKLECSEQIMEQKPRRKTWRHKIRDPHPPAKLPVLEDNILTSNSEEGVCTDKGQITTDTDSTDVDQTTTKTFLWNESSDKTESEASSEEPCYDHCQLTGNQANILELNQTFIEQIFSEKQNETKILYPHQLTETNENLNISNASNTIKQTHQEDATVILNSRFCADENASHINLSTKAMETGPHSIYYMLSVCLSVFPFLVNLHPAPSSFAYLFFFTALYVYACTLFLTDAAIDDPSIWRSWLVMVGWYLVLLWIQIKCFMWILPSRTNHNSYVTKKL